ncbi:hypothetical protein KAR52_03350 [Candidatus Pacearchaeota archaeon]|nr:hypothetical protein [Candidatus Pacearchaeota archaeon]
MTSYLNKNSNPPDLGILYGSRKEGKDIDLFFVFKGIPVQKNIVYNQFDLSQIKFNDFQFRLENFDIEYTEPILTGEYLFGDIEILKKAKEFLKTSKPNKENLNYLSKRALETYLQAEVFYAQGKNELFNEKVNEENFKDLTSKLLTVEDFDFYCPRILKSLSLLTYSLSYLASKKRYSNGEKQVTFKGILNKPITKYDKALVNLIRYFKSKNEISKMNMSKINQYFANTKNLLIGQATN